MVHPALLRTCVASGPAVGRSPLGRSAWKPLESAKRLFGGLHRWMHSGYRPERHYMRGGRTAGAKSLVAG